MLNRRGFLKVASAVGVLLGVGAAGKVVTAQGNGTATPCAVTTLPAAGKQVFNTVGCSGSHDTENEFTHQSASKLADASGKHFMIIASNLLHPPKFCLMTTFVFTKY